MRKYLGAAALAGALIATPVAAADTAGPAIIPSLTPSAVTTSCYVAALGGGAVTGSKPDGAVLPASISTQSWSVAGGIGCDVRMDRVVIGALGRIEAPIDTSGSLIEMDKSWMAALRLGFMLDTGVMPYVLAGYESSDFSVAGIDLRRDGLTVGGGLEIPLSAHLRLITEYTYTGLGKTDALGPTVETDAHKFRVGLSYRFGFGE